MAIISGVDKKSGNVMTWFFKAGRALVESICYSGEEKAAHDGNAYIAHAVCHTAAAASGTLMYIKNLTPDKDFHITRIYIDAQTLTPTDLLLTQAVNPATVTGGTVVTTSVVVQKNTSKNNNFAGSGAIITMSDGSSDCTITGGDQFHEYPIDSREKTTRNMEGTNVIGPGGEWVIGYKREGGGNATDGEKISLSVNGYVDDVS